MIFLTRYSISILARAVIKISCETNAKDLAFSVEYQRICVRSEFVSFAAKTQHGCSKISVYTTKQDNYLISQYLPIATTGSPIGAVLGIKSPISAGLSYTQFGKTGIGCVGFFLLCLSLSSLRVTSAD